MIPMRKKFGYAAGDLGISIAYFAVGFFFMFYLTDIVGMSPLLAGTVILIGRVWDGINDPFIGIISDRTKSSFGRKRVYILFGSIPFAISFFLLWISLLWQQLVCCFILRLTQLWRYPIWQWSP